MSYDSTVHEDYGYRVLFVEDNTACRTMAYHALRKSYPSVYAIEDACTALNLLNKQTFDLVVTDIFMRPMTGVELMMRLSESHPHLPVMAITSDTSGGKAKYLQMGFKDVLLKPYQSEDLTAAIDRFCFEKRTQQRQKQQRNVFGQRKWFQWLLGG